MAEQASSRIDKQGNPSRWDNSDLARRDHEVTLALINGTIGKYISALEQTGVTPETVSPEAEALLQDVDQFIQEVANFAPEAGQHVMDRYASVMEKLNGTDASPLDIISARIQSAPDGILIITDMDDTQTEFSQPSLDNPGYLVHIPGSAHAEPMLDRYGREAFAGVFTQTWQPVLQETPEVFAQAGQYAPLRTGSQELYAAAAENGIPYHILSANFRPLVEAVAKRIANGNEGPTQIWAVEPDSIRSTAKFAVIELIAKMHPDHAVVYLGDGSSDEEAQRKPARKMVAGYFALEGAGFARSLAAEQIPHATYRTMNDVMAVLQHAGALPSTTAPEYIDNSAQSQQMYAAA